VIRGMQAPLAIHVAANLSSCTPVITNDGTLYAPTVGSPYVTVVAADGTLLPSLPLASLGMSTRSRHAAFVEATGTLLLTDAYGDFSKLVAADAVSKAVRWSTSLGGGCEGIAVLPAQGAVIVSDFHGYKLRVHRLSDGVRVASANAVLATYVAADPASGTVYVSTVARSSREVSAFRWDGAALVAEGVVGAAGTAVDDRPLAMLPPTPGRHTSYLVVGTRLKPTLRVLSLPSRRLVHTHTLDGMLVTGLAADPSGTALAVCDYTSNAIHVLPWPLPGMPPLQ
jgi:DNA-binding beta-propeller fold protein YncE